MTRLAIVSDIHANLEALQATAGDIATCQVDLIVCLGDVVGYNANPAECIALLRDLAALCIAGSHERAVTGQISTEGFSDVATRAVAWTRRRLDQATLEFLASLPLRASLPGQLVAVHGALHPEIGCELVRLDNDEDRRLSFDALAVHPSRARICAFGHTHRVGIFERRNGEIQEITGDQATLRQDSYYLINPGTVGQPRTAERRATYMLLDFARESLTVRRVSYDASAAFAKTRRAGLLPAFYFIPAPIRTRVARGLRAVGIDPKRIVRRLSPPSE